MTTKIATALALVFLVNCSIEAPTGSSACPVTATPGTTCSAGACTGVCEVTPTTTDVPSRSWCRVTDGCMPNPIAHLDDAGVHEAVDASADGDAPDVIEPPP